MAFFEVQALPVREFIPGFSGRAIHTENVTVMQWEIESGAELPEHSHKHEQVSTLIAGEFMMTIDDQSHLMTNGEVAVIPSGAVHSGRALTQCQFLDVFHPVREDYK
jgi:quercetin dioxygenase-like cupin family protein